MQHLKNPSPNYNNIVIRQKSREKKKTQQKKDHNPKREVTGKWRNEKKKKTPRLGLGYGEKW